MQRIIIFVFLCVFCVLCGRDCPGNYVGIIPFGSERLIFINILDIENIPIFLFLIFISKYRKADV
jgi:hypothetical protein